MSAYNFIQEDKVLWEKFILSEEYDSDSLRDEHDRFPASATTNKRIDQPWVSEYFKSFGPQVSYPDGKDFCFCITHDIDALRTSKKASIRKGLSGIKRANSSNISSSFRSYINPYNSKLMDYTYRMLEIEKKYNAEASYYFLSLKKEDRDFNFEVNKIRSLFSDLKKSDMEIGLHGGHEAYSDLVVLNDEKKRLEDAAQAKVVGYRNHYLKFKVPITWNILKEAGIEYDSTVGYADTVGFRNGMTHPYLPYDKLANNFISILEIPLTCMDVTLTRYMGKNSDESFEIIKDLVQKVKNVNGVFTLLWHNKDSYEDLDLFDRILNYANESNAWLTSGQKLMTWWNSQVINSSMN